MTAASVSGLLASDVGSGLGFATGTVVEPVGWPLLGSGSPNPGTVVLPELDVVSVPAGTPPTPVPASASVVVLLGVELPPSELEGFLDSARAAFRAARAAARSSAFAAFS